MTEEEKLQKAYFILGLEPGSDLDKVIRRHKRLIMVWHPDRFPTEEGKKDAEEELKKINNAKDDLKSHFEKNHKATGSCACKPSTAGSSQGTTRSAERPGPGPGKRKTTQETNREDAEAERRNREREQKSAQEAAEKERQRQAAYAATEEKKSAEQAAEQQKRLQDEKLRWKLTACIAVAWIGLSLFGWMGTSLKSWWHDFTWKWERDHPSQSSTPPLTNTNTGNTYVPPYEVAPRSNSSSNSTNSNPFGPVGPPPTEQSNSPYSTLESLNKEQNNNAQAPSTVDTTPPSTLGTPGLQQSSPYLFPQTNSSSLRDRANKFLNSGSSSTLNNPAFSPDLKPTISPFGSPSGTNSFAQTIEELKKKTDHEAQ